MAIESTKTEYNRTEVDGVAGAFVLSGVLNENECERLKQGIIKLHKEAEISRVAKFRQ